MLIIIVDHIQRQRKFQGIDFEKRSPNLIVTERGKHNNIEHNNLLILTMSCSLDLVLKCALMLYAEDNEMPLPTQEEVLICTSQTTAEEVL